MEADKKYITQLTASDLREIAAVANIQVGDGIVIERSREGLVIGIDKQQLRIWVNQLISGQEI